LSKVLRLGIINDIHGPWEDVRGLALFLDVFSDIGIEHLIINGDLLDFFNLSQHGPKHPDVQAVLEDELGWGIEFLTNLRKKFPKTKITYLFGNHEDRLDRWTIRHCPAYWNIVKLESQLQLAVLDIEFFPYNTKYKVGDTSLNVMHSPPSYGKSGSMTSLETKLNESFIYGCTHRIQHSCKTGSNGEIVHSWFNGWLGNNWETIQHKRVFSFIKGHSNWQGGGSIAFVHPDNTFYVEQISIDSNYRIYTHGNLYQG